VLIEAPWDVCLWCFASPYAYRNGLCRACAAYRRKYGRLRPPRVIDRHLDRHLL
jgi:hypothetical protein